MSDKDILNIDARIRKKFKQEFQRIPIHKEKLTDLKTSLESKDLEGRLRKDIQYQYNKLSEHIKKVESSSDLNFYLAKTVHLIEKYKGMLRVPIKMSFMGKPIKENKKKKVLVNSYFQIARQYIDINRNDEKGAHNIVCNNCRNKKDFDIMNKNTYVCMKCFSQQTIMKHNS